MSAPTLPQAVIARRRRAAQRTERLEAALRSALIARNPEMPEASAQESARRGMELLLHALRESGLVVIEHAELQRLRDAAEGTER